MKRRIFVSWVCKSCHSETKPHRAKGMCTTCYARAYQRLWRKYRKEKDETRRKAELAKIIGATVVI
jgi:hypothetical protein